MYSSLPLSINVSMGRSVSAGESSNSKNLKQQKEGPQKEEEQRMIEEKLAQLLHSEDDEHSAETEQALKKLLSKAVS